MAEIEIKRVGEIPYTKPIARALLRDARLSFGARGLFSFLWDLPDGWQTNIKHLSTMGPQGREAIRSLIRELEAVAAMQDKPIQNEVDGKFAGRQWVLFAPHLWALEFGLSSKKWSDEMKKMQPRGVSGTRSSEKAAFREKPQFVEPDPKVLQGEGFATLKVFAAASGGAAAPSPPKKKRRERQSGIITWDQRDEAEALRLEARFTQSELAAAVKSLQNKNKKILPGLVAAELNRLAQQAAAATREEELARAMEEKDRKSLQSSHLASAGANKLMERALAISKKRKEVRT